MFKPNLGLLVLAFAAGAVCGCRGVDADLSPDGKTVVIGDGNGLTLVPVDGKGPARTVNFEPKPNPPSTTKGTIVTSQDVRSPRYSPDGKWILAAEKDRAALVDAKTLQKYPILGITFPFAWSPNSRFFLGSAGRRVKVFQTSTRQYIRSIYLSQSPGGVFWATDEGDMAFSDAKGFCVVDRKNTKRFRPKAFVVLQSLDSRRHRLIFERIYALHASGRRSELFPHGSRVFGITAINVDSGQITTLLPKTASSKLFPNERLIAYGPGSDAIAPDLSELAAYNWIDKNSVRLEEHAKRLNRQLKKRPSKWLKNEATALEERLERGLVPCLAFIWLNGSHRIERVPVTERPTYPPPSGAIKPEIGYDAKLFWAADGRSVVLVDTGNCVLRVPVPR